MSYPQQPVVVVQQPQSNTIGMAGFIMSLLSLLTCGILFPLGLIFSFIGCFYKPRGFALAGLAISLGSILVLVISWGLFLGAFFGALAIGNTVIEMEKEHYDSAQAVQRFYEDNQRMPDDDELSHVLPFPERVRLENIDGSSGDLIHSSFDGLFNTADDIREHHDFSQPLPAETFPDIDPSEFQ